MSLVLRPETFCAGKLRLGWNRQKQLHLPTVPTDAKRRGYFSVSRNIGGDAVLHRPVQYSVRYKDVPPLQRPGTSLPSSARASPLPSPPRRASPLPAPRPPSPPRAAAARQ